MADNKCEAPRGRLSEKLHNNHGLSWLLLILIIAVVVLFILFMAPGYKRSQTQGKTVACATALDSARRVMAKEFMFDGFENSDVEQAKADVTKAMQGWDDLCPDGGNVYITKRDGALEWDLVCGLHDSDKKLCTRLNASNVLGQLNERLLKEHNMGNFYPETLPFTLHHKEYTAVLVNEPTNFKRGTRTTMGMEDAGIVAYYSIKDYSDFGADSKAEAQTIWYFSFADEDHCATWTADEQWTGDSYQGIALR